MGAFRPIAQSPEKLCKGQFLGSVKVSRQPGLGLGDFLGHWTFGPWSFEKLPLFNRPVIH